MIAFSFIIGSFKPLRIIIKKKVLILECGRGLERFTNQSPHPTFLRNVFVTYYTDYENKEQQYIM